MSFIKRITDITEKVGVKRGDHKIEPYGGHVLVWENLEEEQLKKLAKELKTEFGKQAVIVEENTIILRYQRRS